MKAVLKKAACYDREVRNGEWCEKVGSELSGKTVGLIGFGGIPRILAAFLKAMNVRVLAFDQHGQRSFGR